MFWFSKFLVLMIPIIAIGGLFYPMLGFFLFLDMFLLMTVSPFKGRLFCSHLCSRGIFTQTYLKRFSRNKKIPTVFRSMWIRIPILVLMMTNFVYRIVKADGVVLKIGNALVGVYIMTTLVVIFFDVLGKPRTWCTICPMGTMQRFLDRGHHKVKIDSEKCISCESCHKECPMDIEVTKDMNKPDCIKCKKCVKTCPKGALRL